MGYDSPQGQQKITLTLPKSLLARLDASVPARRRSRFIVEAIEERLAIEEQLAALDESAGAWTDDNHSDLQTEADVDNWLRDLRASWSTNRS
jgi:metal-responsive CopG/Arc/MetJ family transcriptional regulator